jgi:uncharacterized repeat protein (TIGR03803 family)
MFAAEALASGLTATTIYTFTGMPDGAGPDFPLFYAKDGNLYGATANGGQFGYGAVFELSPPTVAGGAWTETILYSFTGGDDGLQPSSSVILGNGPLFGETLYGGASNAGIVYKLTPPTAPGGVWTETTLYSFCVAGNPCTDGEWPMGGLAFDKGGNIYGTAQSGGNAQTACCGVVFELLNPHGGVRSTWQEKVIYNFLGNYSGQNDGSNPEAGVLFDSAGNLYGTTLGGGDYSACQGGGCGTVFELTSAAGVWTESPLYIFQGIGDGNGPSGRLLFDSSGNLYGTTSGETVYNPGNVFKLSPPTGGSGPWTETVLYTFLGAPLDGSSPNGLVLFGRNLFGTTSQGGSGSCLGGCGTVFTVAAPKSGTVPWTETILWNFTDTAYYPEAAPTSGEGAVYSVTSDGAGSSCQGVCGTVLELSH